MTLRQEDQRSTDLRSLTPKELVRAGIETERLEVIPIERIQQESAVIDESHALELGESMRQKRGQITPIAVRVREQGEQIIYDIIDGFHRVEGKRRNGERAISATVIYGCPDEELYDLRILAASSVKSVQFPRIAQWISRSFETTPWAKKGLTVTNAFAIAMNDSQRSNIVRLTSQEIEELKTWVGDKCKRWGKTVYSTYAILRIVANADPELVRQVRTSGGGKDRTGKITPERLQRVVERFPGPGYFNAQRAILRVAVERRLYSEETQRLVQVASRFVKPGMNEEYIYQALQKGHLAHSGTGQSGREEEGEVGLNQEEQVKLPRVRRRKSKNPQRLAVRGENISSLKQRVKELEEALEIANKRRDTDGVGAWWRTAPYLTSFEKTCIEKTLYGDDDLEDLLIQLRAPLSQIFLTVRSAFRKYRLMSGKKERVIYQG